jgi:hypothetical protein
VWGEELVTSIGWRELAEAGKLKVGTVVDSPTGVAGPSLRLIHRGPQPMTFPLVTIDRPPINMARYALRGRVTYNAVSKDSYLEMWSYLAEGAFFSRTLGENGPMQRLEGSSGQRAFVVPFSNREGGAPPERLVFNLVLTGAGTVEIGPLELVQFAANEDMFADDNAWWSERQGGALGGVIGSVLGIVGAVIGWLASAGRAKGFVLSALTAIAWLGIAALVGGAGALVGGQPYAVYYPLMLLGAISAGLGLFLPRALNRRYQDLELRRMQALDV